MQPERPTGEPIAGSEVPTPDMSGKTLGDFKLLRRLGQGGMGQVYVAEQISLKRKVALKVLKPEVALNPTSLKRFLIEAEVIARATHANIVQVYWIGEENGTHYMALEYVEGLNLREFLAKKGTPDVPQALSVMRQVAAALARAGELGITHRDIKPENILLTRKGEVKVADFGLSRDIEQSGSLSQSGVAMGTPLYMSPEQVQGQRGDPRSDIYSFGVTCYHMLAGQPPFQGQSPLEVAEHHLHTAASPLHAVRPDLPADLCAVVDRMMAKKPEDRFQTARDILRELNRLRDILVGQSQAGLLPVEPSVARPALTGAPTPKQRLRTFALVAASLVLAALGGAALAWLQHRDRGPPGSLAVPNEEERFLRLQVKAFEQAGGDPRELEEALRAHINLGLYLIDRQRLAEADVFFAVLREHHQQEYRGVGALGQALVLAFQDQPAKSNALLLDCQRQWLGNKEKSKAVLDHAGLRLLLARALDRNAAHDPSAFPANLETLRVPAAALADRPK